MSEQPDGASIVETDSFLASEKALLDINRKSKMGSFTGPSGTGKTFAIRDLAHDLPNTRVVWLEFESRPTILHMARKLYEGLLAKVPKGNRNKLSGEIIDALRRRTDGTKLMLVVDEAQRLNTECIEYLRYLFDHVGTGFSLAILGGHGAWEVIEEEPMLLSRIYRQVRFRPIPDSDVIKTIRNYHPIFEDADKAFILRINEYCKGVFRPWAAITETLIDLLEENETANLDEETVEDAIELVFGT